MVEIAVPGGTKFCIDSTEVTEAHYAVFLGQVATKPGSEHPQCKGNTSYLLNDPHSGDDPLCGGHNNPRGADPKSNLPVQCIDWCDAYAYCAWAGKRLCGKIGGGAGSAGPDGWANKDPAVSQWYYVCSQGGKTKYPYGDAYDPKACEGLDATKLPADSATQQAPITEVGAWPGCKGSAPPFSGVFDMSGSVVEFTDECMWWGNQFGCSIRGGSFGGRESDLTCAAGGALRADVPGGVRRFLVLSVPAGGLLAQALRLGAALHQHRAERRHAVVQPAPVAAGGRQRLHERR
jgi:formylglycine-generating enzyme required for sulfatase activity